MLTSNESICATPLGLMPQRGLANLGAFGAQADRLEYPYIDVGGFIVPGRDPVAINPPGTERDRDAAAARAGSERRKQPASEQARPAAGTRQRSSQAAPGASPRALGDRLTTLNLDLSALVAFHPLTRVVASTEAVVYMNIPLGLIPQLPIGARLTLEVPLALPAPFTPSWPLPDVPDVRAWAVWEGGSMHGQRIVSHHRYPDQAICANLTGEWRLGVHPLHHYVAFCALWAAKALHERLLGFYPGRQHYPAAVRLQRNRPDEYCGCGAPRRYRDCCCNRDLAMRPYELWRDAQGGRMRYLSDLARQERASAPPDALFVMGLNLR